MLHTDASFDFSSPTHCGHGHEQLDWTHGNPYPTFGVNFDLNGYSDSCGHQSGHIAGGQLGLHQHTQLSGQEFGVHQHTQLANEELQVSEAMLERDGNNVMVKHEDWDNAGF